MTLFVRREDLEICVGVEMKKIFATIATIVAVFSAATAASAAVIDFQSLEVANNTVNLHGDIYLEDGFTLTEVGVFEFGTFGTLETRYPGSTALFSDTIGGQITLTRTGGGTFNLNSIDLALLNGPGSVTVSFTGATSGGGTPVASFTVNDPAMPLNLFTFLFPSSFTDLLSVTWTQNDPFHQFDNIVLDSAQQVVPEPSSLLLLGTGAAAMVVVARRRRKQRIQ